jgi:hypothetical protein
MIFMLQVGELPSIDLVRIVGGKIEEFSVDRISGERGHRALGFISIVQKFEDKVCMTSLSTRFFCSWRSI